MIYRETSRDAWESMQDALGPIDSRIVEFIRSSGGATSDEIEVELDMKHQTVSAQIRHLNERNILTPTLFKRRTRSGRKAIVWAIR